MDNWVYSLKNVYQVLQEFADIFIAYDHFHIAIRRYVHLFKEAGSVDSKKGSGRPTNRKERMLKRLGNW